MTANRSAIPGDLPFRRRVFYIPGYDPFPPRRYRELYRKEAAVQAAISGYDLAFVHAAQGQQTGHRAGHRAGPYGWSVKSRIEGRAARADIQVLVWSDIVQASMGQGIIATYVQLLRTVWAYMGTGALFRLMRLRAGPMIAALYPIGLLLAELAVALLVAWGGARLVPAMSLPVYLVLCGAVVWAVLWLFRRADRYLLGWYLMHDYAFTAQNGGALPDLLGARLDAFRKTLAEALTEEWDEVLVVGHSSGAHLGISMLADTIRAGEVPKTAPALGFLSLGQVVPMVSFLPGATRLRADLAYLSERSELTWVDVTAPGDGCAFALCDPVAVSGMAGPQKRWPLVLSAAFSQTLSPERWQALRRRYFRLHFQYLCAFDRPGDYDYFRITAGPIPLAKRFAGRSPSKNRIETPLNRYGRAG